MGICSAHQNYDPDCRLCKMNIRDLFPDWYEIMKNYKIIKCDGCMFEYYNTVDSCPKCNKLLSIIRLVN
jgi:hypothetical protein